MRWATGFEGCRSSRQKPAGGSRIPGFNVAWTVGPMSVRTVDDGESSRIAFLGDCLATDAELGASLKAVRACGWLELAEWPGSYLVVVQTGQRTVVIGDRAGVWPVFYRTDLDGGVWWSNAATPLAALDGPPALDFRALAARTAMPDVELNPRGSLFSKVARVPPEMALVCEAGEARLAVARKTPETLSFTVGAEFLRDRLTEAVVRRVRSTAFRSSDMSGGLDSTTLAHLSAKAGDTLAVTYTDKWLLNDDLRYATAAARTPGLVHRVVTGDTSTVHYAGLSADRITVPLSDAPSPSVVLWAMKSAIFTAMTAYGSFSHLVGTGGDTVLTASGIVTDAIRNGHPWEAAVTARAAARVNNTSAWSLWRASRAKASLPLRTEAEHLANRLRGPGTYAAAAAGASESAVWLPAQATVGWMPREARILLADYITNSCIAREDPPSLARWRDGQGVARVGDDIAQYAHMAASFGVRIWAPYVDDQVIRACFGVPPETRHVPGEYKPLLVRAMRGIVADTVLERRTKGTFNGPVYAGLASHSRELSELVGADSRLARLGLIDPAPFKTVLGRAAAGLHMPLGSVHNVVAVEVWLRLLESQCRSIWWKEVPSHAMDPA
ncbi:albusnodin/ikarugamycin family macrolactam cyclase [Streptomyces sioyaensis]|uniref:albusnodin/ikarugamycin family macrolactam cyclase n=1 Tax=Streptomyces sioyaensis TaxID=67364 RepID=UPI00379251D2